MKQKPRKPAVPRPAEETIRRTIIDLIREQPQSAREISILAHIPEKEVYGHLEHIRFSIHQTGFLEITPSECRSCGFVFAKRYRLKPPGKCPVCRAETIHQPLFLFRERHSSHGRA